MPDRSTVIYRYDGSYQGFLCCVAQCFQDKALPVSIRPYDEEQQSLYGSKDIGRGSSPRCRSGRWPCCALCCWATSTGPP